MRSANMGKARMEAFSDGVIAVIITIMVLELKVPGGHTLADLASVRSVFINYVMSFVYVGIYWNNHHHMMQVVKSINGTILWANLYLLFWLSMIPFVTSWMGESPFTYPWPTALYGFVLLMNSIAYTFLVIALIRHEGKSSMLATAFGKDWKGKISTIIYCVAIPLNWVSTYISFGLYVLVACIWFVPDTRIERKVAEEAN